MACERHICRDRILRRKPVRRPKLKVGWPLLAVFCRARVPRLPRLAKTVVVALRRQAGAIFIILSVVGGRLRGNDGKRNSLKPSFPPTFETPTRLDGERVTRVAIGVKDQPSEVAQPESRYGSGWL